MSEIRILHLAIQCFAFVHLCACSRTQVGRSAARQTTARARQATAREPMRRDTTSADTGNLISTDRQIRDMYRRTDVEIVEKHQLNSELRKLLSTELIQIKDVVSARKKPRTILKDPEFFEGDVISNLIGKAGLESIRVDYFQSFTHTQGGFTGPVKAEFVADCMRDVLHWIGEDTETTPEQRMKFCEKFWKKQHAETDFADEIKRMQGPCDNEGESTVQSVASEGNTRPCHESGAAYGQASGEASTRTFGGGGGRVGGRGGGGHGSHDVGGAGSYGGRGGGAHSSSGRSDTGRDVTVDQLNRALQSEGASVAEGRRGRDGSVSSVGDSDTTSHWAHGDKKEGVPGSSYPEAKGTGNAKSGANSNSPFRPTGWKSDSKNCMMALGVLGMLVAEIDF